MPKDREHVEELVQKFYDSGINAVDMVEQMDTFMQEFSRPAFVFRINRRNPRPGSAVRFRDAILEMDEFIMRYASWRNNAEQ